jgi:invasion protein IalB
MAIKAKHVLAGGLGALLAMTVAAHAQSSGVAPQGGGDRVVNGQRFGAWAVQCEAVAINETVCVLSQRLVRSSDRAFLAEIIAFQTKDASKSYVAARVPLGVHFPSGFSVKPAGEGQQVPFVWQSCSQTICEALLEVDAAMISRLESAEQLVGGYRPGLQAEPLVFRMSVKGLSEGLTALNRGASKGE